MINPKILSIAHTFPKHDVGLQNIFIKILEEIYPPLDQWYRQKSKASLGFEISVKFQMAQLVRNLWRAIVVGQSCNDEFLAMGDHHVKMAQFRWDRASTKLLESIFSLHQGPHHKASKNQTPRDRLLSRVFRKLENFFITFWIAREYDHKYRFIVSEFSSVWKNQFGKEIIAANDIKQNTINLIFFRPSSDTRRFLLAVNKYTDWNILPGGPVSVQPISVHWQAKDRADLLENIHSKIEQNTELKLLAKKLLQDAMKNFLHSSPNFWDDAAAVYKKLENVPEGVPCAFVAHPDMSNTYYAYLAACEAHGISVLEVQHGCQHIRLNHTVGLAWRILPSFYLTFGDFTDFDQAKIPERQRILKLFGHKVTHIAGVFWRSNFFHPVKKRAQKVQKILVGSYFLGDFDECEFFFPDQEIINQEVNIITELSKHEDLEVYVKIRPVSSYSVVQYLDKEVLKKIKIIDVAAKAGHAMIKKYDAMVAPMYATMTLEAVSLGVPVVFCPSEKEYSLLMDDFIEAAAASTNEIRLVRNTKDLYPALQSFNNTVVDTENNAQDFSRKYAHYASTANIKIALENLRKEILTRYKQQ